jgi:hypothetical protein
VSAADMQNADNDILISHLKEITTVFTKFILPRLSDWESFLSYTKNEIETRPLGTSIECELTAQLPAKLDKISSLKNSVSLFLSEKSNKFFDV